jgi:opacity protein-like surface antigen
MYIGTEKYRLYISLKCFCVCFVLFLCSGILSSVSWAQRTEIGVGVGGFNYRGDISPAFQFKFFKPGGSVFFRYNPSAALSLRAELAGGIIGATDAKSTDPFQLQRNKSFRTRMVEGSAVAEYNFLNFEDRRFAVNWSPYVFGGLGYTFFSVSPNTGIPKNTSFVLPYGVGIKYQIKRPWNIGLEYGTRKTFTDYLDNLGPEPMAQSQAESGNHAVKDTYFYVRLSVSYTFYKLFCP